MKVSNAQWMEKLSGEMPEGLAREIEIFETELSLRKQDKIEERIFAETRLRRGVYGQRYDNGQRHDGKQVQEIAYPSGALTKGPNTMWDAPGMQRIKLPAGGLNARQLETLAELAEEYSDGIAHITTRQDVQLHYIHIEDTPALMRRLAAAEITTREACGNGVRNVTACPYAGVCQDEAFDVTPYSLALARFLLGHPDCQDFGRKFKPSFSGCVQHACGLARMHDLGLVGVEREENGERQRGFQLFVGGGLGAVPHQAKLFDSFIPPEELLPLAQSIARVYARLGEKRNRNRARLKFLVADLGIEKFRELVLEERKTLAPDPRWTEFIPSAGDAMEGPLHPGGPVPETGPEPFRRWLASNTRPQRQPGYRTVTVTLPLGDITANQLRSLADIVRRYTRESLRTTVEQNLLIRWVSGADLPDLYRDLEGAGLGAPGAGTIIDVVTCPGTDTCKLGISSSRGLAAELRQRLAEGNFQRDEAVQNLHVKVSGCFNSCGQHHVADLGFYGVSRKMAGYAVPHFQLVLGGAWDNNAESYGLPVMAIPSKNVPDAVARLTDRYVSGRNPGEAFRDFIGRVGKMEVKKMLEDLTRPPASGDRSFFRDWNDPREYTLGDMGTGECAGEVVSPVEFGLVAAERQVFEAQLALEAGDAALAWATAYRAMWQAAKSLLMTGMPGLADDPEIIVAEFRTRFYDTKRFYDPFAGGKFAHYFFAAHREANAPHTLETARHLIEEAQLFIEASHGCYNRQGTLVSI
ncbi:MAG TPA: nitrite/sulfite reductase [Candidatus Dormibacteraeota bacterium]|nr:nitrite/sulfite reductase [Candidatus Dormibacteraeota bacterium]